MSAPESWKAAYRELIETIVRMGYPEEFGKAIAKNLGSEKTMRRMTAYLYGGTFWCDCRDISGGCKSCIVFQKTGVQRDFLKSFLFTEWLAKANSGKINKTAEEKQNIGTVSSFKIVKEVVDNDMSRTMTVKKTSTFPAGRQEVFLRLQKLSTLQKIAWPYASFTPVSGQDDRTWTVGNTSSYKFRLFGIIPFGTHRIRVIRFDERDGIYTNEKNEHVPIWNHEIILRELSDHTCEYTDQVEIGAGWKTVFIYLWACCFYRHRQRKWIRLLKKSRRRKAAHRK